MFDRIKNVFAKSSKLTPDKERIKFLEDVIMALTEEGNELENRIKALNNAFGLLQAEYQAVSNQQTSICVLLTAALGYEVHLDADFIAGVDQIIKDEDLTVWFDRTDNGMDFRVMSRAEAEQEATKRAAALEQEKSEDVGEDEDA